MLRILYWNIRGIGNQSSRRELKSDIHRYKPDIVGITEPMVKFVVIYKLFWASINFVLLMTNQKLFPRYGFWYLRFGKMCR